MNNPITAAMLGMKLGVARLNMIKRAEAQGYAGVAKSDGLDYKTYGCGKCRTNTALKFVNINAKKAALACPCGWRKKVKV